MASLNLEKKGNFTRLSRLLVDKGTEALRITFDAIHPPANLPAVLNGSRTSLLRLKPRVINDAQWELLFPPSGNPPDSKTFDVTLLTVLFRNICGLPPPATGWNAMPLDTDRSPQANITRVRLLRNQIYAHVSSTEVDKTEFENLWQKVSVALIALKIPQKEIDNLKTCPLSREEEIYVCTLKEWVLKEEDCKNILDDLRTNVKSMQQQLMQPDLQRVEEQLLQRLAKHNFKSKVRSKAKLFHPGTRKWLLEWLELWFRKEDESRLLLITAGPGFGKSVFSAKVCELFSEKGKLAACHFCDFSDSNLKDPMMMLQSLASHMCVNIPGFKEKLLDQLKRPYKVNSLKDAFQIYLQNPLDELDAEPSLIVIDGLDESATDDKSDMLKLMANHFSDLPKCVKVLVTSRPELSRQVLNHIKVIKVARSDWDNKLDLLKYLTHCLPSLAPTNTVNPPMETHEPRFNEILRVIVEKCEGSFLYAFHFQDELRKCEDLETMTVWKVVNFLPEGLATIYQAYFHRLEIELEVVMNKKPDLFKVLELFVVAGKSLPLTFIARTLDLDPDCREMVTIINKVNEVVSCLLNVSESNDVVTFFHRSVYDWLLAKDYKHHEYSVTVSNGKKRLWLLCEQIFEEIKTTVALGRDVRLSKEVKYALEMGHDYLVGCSMKERFTWLVDFIIVHVILAEHPKNVVYLQLVLQKVLRSDIAISLQLRQRISWHYFEISSMNESFSSMNIDPSFHYLHSVLHHSPEGCFTDSEKRTAKLLLTRVPGYVKRYSVPAKSMELFLAQLFPSIITAIGVSSNKKLVAVALEGGTINVLSLPELARLFQYSTRYKRVSCCAFGPDDSFLLYGKLESALNIADQNEVSFFNGQHESFRSCSFSPNGKRLITNDGSDTVKLWDVARQILLSNLCAEGAVEHCWYSKTGLFIIGNQDGNEEVYCVWNSITLQRVDRRSLSSCKIIKKDGVPKSERCDRCFRQEGKELIPFKDLRNVAPIVTSRRYSSIAFNERYEFSKTFAGSYNEVDCVFHLYMGSLHVIECTHYTTLAAWVISIPYCQFRIPQGFFVALSALKDDQFLYAGLEKLMLFNSMSSKDDHSCLSRPTRVLWCSFSPDGNQLATCTSDGFINLWSVSMSQIYQRFEGVRGTTPAACWWSDKYLFVFHFLDGFPSLSRYQIGENLKIASTQGESIPLRPVVNAFLPFSGILDFSEGYLNFERGETEPVKVLYLNKMQYPKIVDLPGIRPMMRIAVSVGASFILGIRYGYILWKRDKSDPALWKWHSVNMSLGFPLFGCCFSDDSKLAVSYLPIPHHFLLIDVGTGHAFGTMCRGTRKSFGNTANIFCTNRLVVLVTSKLVEIFDRKSHKLLESSFERNLTDDSLIHSKLSPKGTVLAVPTLTGDVDFFQINTPDDS